MGGRGRYESRASRVSRSVFVLLIAARLISLNDLSFFGTTSTTTSLTFNTSSVFRTNLLFDEVLEILSPTTGSYTEQQERHDLLPHFYGTRSESDDLGQLFTSTFTTAAARGQHLQSAHTPTAMNQHNAAKIATRRTTSAGTTRSSTSSWATSGGPFCLAARPRQHDEINGEEELRALASKASTSGPRPQNGDVERTTQDGIFRMGQELQGDSLAPPPAAAALTSSQKMDVSTSSLGTSDKNVQQQMHSVAERTADQSWDRSRGAKITSTFADTLYEQNYDRTMVEDNLFHGAHLPGPMPGVGGGFPSLPPYLMDDMVVPDAKPMYLYGAAAAGHNVTVVHQHGVEKFIPGYTSSMAGPVAVPTYHHQPAQDYYTDSGTITMSDVHLQQALTPKYPLGFIPTVGSSMPEPPTPPLVAAQNKRAMLAKAHDDGGASSRAAGSMFAGGPRAESISADLVEQQQASSFARGAAGPAAAADNANTGTGATGSGSSSDVATPDPPAVIAGRSLKTVQEQIAAAEEQKSSRVAKSKGGVQQTTNLLKPAEAAARPSAGELVGRAGARPGLKQFGPRRSSSDSPDAKEEPLELKQEERNSDEAAQLHGALPQKRHHEGRPPRPSEQGRPPRPSDREPQAESFLRQQPGTLPGGGLHVTEAEREHLMGMSKRQAVLLAGQQARRVKERGFEAPDGGRRQNRRLPTIESAMSMCSISSGGKSMERKRTCLGIEQNYKNLVHHQHKQTIRQHGFADPAGEQVQVGPPPLAPCATAPTGAIASVGGMAPSSSSTSRAVAHQQEHHPEPVVQKFRAEAVALEELRRALHADPDLARHNRTSTTTSRAARAQSILNSKSATCFTTGSRSSTQVEEQRPPKKALFVEGASGGGNKVGVRHLVPPATTSSNLAALQEEHPAAMDDVVHHHRQEGASPSAVRKPPSVVPQQELRTSASAQAVGGRAKKTRGERETIPPQSTPTKINYDQEDDDEPMLEAAANDSTSRSRGGRSTTSNASMSVQSGGSHRSMLSEPAQERKSPEDDPPEGAGFGPAAAQQIKSRAGPAAAEGPSSVGAGGLLPAIFKNKGRTDSKKNFVQGSSTTPTNGKNTSSSTGGSRLEAGGPRQPGLVLFPPVVEQALNDRNGLPHFQTRSKQFEVDPTVFTPSSSSSTTRGGRKNNKAPVYFPLPAVCPRPPVAEQEVDSFFKLRKAETPWDGDAWFLVRAKALANADSNAAELAAQPLPPRAREPR
ncbi:unnamed protein product, partial [Amoebophrya sp. A120]|eukprot:GSA120T00008349001.1